MKYVLFLVFLETSFSTKSFKLSIQLEGNVKIVDIIVGGPIWKDKLLDIGDIILKVAQEDKDP